ncbi:NTP transferase domain-containing protein [Tianweitania populi]|uniref:4-diphosphocytidyl-2C-methyl-D-erythritol kinase n=1 Tax=Tianweitania populi TaxID=1607949 RepID=A0A8J3GJ75_9HYPH|nr:molybdopterin-binding/glycosyltransferase family 2 protein [Tianweitania populi]GHD08041.1 4-diphosphocytidyl-2C-methyl-D-erythritol kinase [Tianweitania populi]
MKFGPVPVPRAEGVVLAHAVSAGALRFKKAHRLSAGDVEALAQAGVPTVVAATLDPDDLGENEAAARVAAVIGGDNLEIRDAGTGRVNLHAKAAGVFIVDKASIDAMNSVDPAVTVATLAPFAAVRAGQMVATVKIIPFAVSTGIVEAVVAEVGDASPLKVASFRAARVALIQTERAGLKTSVLDKTAVVTQARLDRSGSRIIREERIVHHAGRLAQTLRAVVDECDLILIFGASAVSDAHDVIPAGIRTARGVVKRVGMPVDPGNLLVLGELEGVPVIGAPGCSRSPKENGFDWVLDRIQAGLEVTDRDIASMGVGGLLGEIATRPAPRERAQRDDEPSERLPGGKSVHAIVLAAGRSSRMGGPNKLLAHFDDEPLIRRVASRVLASGAASVTIITGHQADLVTSALTGLPVNITHNPAYADGMAGSLQAGMSTLPADASGALVVLGDMPEVETADLTRMLQAFDAQDRTAIVRATNQGKRGNPVILPRGCFPEIAELHGDTGARAIIESGTYEVIDVELGQAASVDVDTPAALQAAGGVLAG